MVVKQKRWEEVHVDGQFDFKSIGQKLHFLRKFHERYPILTKFSARKDILVKKMSCHLFFVCYNERNYCVRILTIDNISHWIFPWEIVKTFFDMKTNLVQQKKKTIFPNSGLVQANSFFLCWFNCSRTWCKQMCEHKRGQTITRYTHLTIKTIEQQSSQLKCEKPINHETFSRKRSENILDPNSWYFPYQKKCLQKKFFSWNTTAPDTISNEKMKMI